MSLLELLSLVREAAEVRLKQTKSKLFTEICLTKGFGGGKKGGMGALIGMAMMMKGTMMAMGK